MFLNLFLAIVLNLSFAKMIPTDVLIDSKDHETFNSPFFSIGGSIDSFGGGDTVDKRRLTAWFYGDKPIKTCFFRIDSFSVDEDTIRKYLIQASNKWAQYFKKNRINKLHEVKINSNFNIQKNCNGDEDLIFYFGTGPVHDNLNDLKARQSLSHPIAYSNKTHIQGDLRWSKGYIRFVNDFEYRLFEDRLYPDWSSGAPLFSMILHEFGHVLGFIHKEKTIMTGKIVPNLFVYSIKHQSIDHDDELHPCLNCKKEYQVVSTSDENTFPIYESLYLDPVNQEVVFLENNIQPNYFIFNEVKPVLLSMFQSTSTPLTHPKVYFFFFRGRHFTIEFELDTATIRKDGEAFSELKLKRSL